MVEYIVMGGSLGGTRAAGRVLSQLTEVSVPVLLTLHRHRDNQELLLRFLQEYTTLPIIEAYDKCPLEPGSVYVAPADYHLLLDQGACALSVDAPVLFARPSINVLFESAADTGKQAVIGVLLTGASDDGVAGLQAIKRAGGVCIVQSPASAECAVMPQAAIEAGAADYIVALRDIAAMIMKLLHMQH